MCYSDVGEPAPTWRIYSRRSVVITAAYRPRSGVVLLLLAGRGKGARQAFGVVKQPPRLRSSLARRQEIQLVDVLQTTISTVLSLLNVETFILLAASLILKMQIYKLAICLCAFIYTSFMTSFRLSWHKVLNYTTNYMLMDSVCTIM